MAGAGSRPARRAAGRWSRCNGAIWLGCARKYVSMLNGQRSMPITSLRYFIGLVEEVGQTGTPETYWRHASNALPVGRPFDPCKHSHFEPFGVGQLVISVLLNWPGSSFEVGK